MEKYKIILLIALFLVFAGGVGFYLKENVVTLYNKSIEKFQATDVGSLVSEIKKEVLAPTPLNIGGQENQVVLTKAKVIAETNVQRYDNDILLPLIENAKLNAAAKAKADDMFKNQYFEHVSPSGVDPGALAKKFGYDYIVEGENLILGNFLSEKKMVQDWMDSPGHRANILNKRYVDIGVAVVKGTYKGQTVWIGVQEFGLPLSSCVAADKNLKNKIDTNKGQLDQLSLQIEAKRSEIDNTNQRSSKYNQLVDEYNQLVAQYNNLLGETKNLITQYNNEINTFNECVTGE